MDTHNQHTVRRYILWMLLALAVIFNIYWFLIRGQVTIIDTNENNQIAAEDDIRLLDKDANRPQYVAQQKKDLSQLEKPVVNEENEDEYINAQLLLLQQLENTN